MQNDLILLFIIQPLPYVYVPPYSGNLNCTQKSWYKNIYIVLSLGVLALLSTFTFNSIGLTLVVLVPVKVL